MIDGFAGNGYLNPQVGMWSSRSSRGFSCGLRRSLISSSTFRAFAVCVAALLTVASGSFPTYCQFNEPCWPTSADVAQLYAALNPNLNRSLIWFGPPQPPVSAVPIDSPYDQPLYGHGVHLDPLYALPSYDQKNASTACTDFVHAPEFCFQALRNNPTKGQPAFVAWPTKAIHVQTIMRFANKHQLCVAVAGTGHDFMNRHTCADSPGFLIRTSLFKDVRFNLKDKRSQHGTVTFGSGIVFAEAHKATSARGYYVASGWATTVGVIGWALGGGHGPFVPSSGLGVDNIVEVELVTAAGDLIVANSKTNKDLWWALRGGGGSAWGVITAITVRLHPNPANGFTVATMNFWDGLAKETGGLAKLSTLIDAFLSWAATAPNTFGGMLFIYTYPGNATMPAHWQAMFKYGYKGKSSDSAFRKYWGGLVASMPKTLFNDTDILEVKKWYDVVELSGLEFIAPFKWYPDDPKQAVGGIPSVLLNRTVVASGAVRDLILKKCSLCATTGQCNRQELYHDMTGHVGSPQDPDVSVSPAYRKALLHLVSAGWGEADFAPYYKLGDYSYFSESAYYLPDWRTRYWGNNYYKLRTIKKKWDPTYRFRCHHCVGDNSK